jgi:hypothetical protein
MELVKRTWVYAQPPSDYEMSPCPCGNADTEWSEWKNHLWCPKCQKDFIPEHKGVFDGPIPIEVAKLLGMDFRRVDLETGKIYESPILPPIHPVRDPT